MSLYLQMRNLRTRRALAISLCNASVSGMRFDEDIDCLEQIDVVTDAFDILEATDPTTALAEVIVEDIFVDTIEELMGRI